MKLKSRPQTHLDVKYACIIFAACFWKRILKKIEKVNKIYWTLKNTPDKESENGIYFIRTNIYDLDEQTTWNIYNTIRKIESTFRCLKTELNIRPNYHQKDENIEPHIHLGLLAYQVVSVIRHQLISAGINDSWTTLIEKMNTQKATTTAMMKKNGKKVFVRNCSIPSAELKEIYQVLKLKPVPFYKKKMWYPNKWQTLLYISIYLQLTLAKTQLGLRHILFSDPIFSFRLQHIWRCYFSH